MSYETYMTEKARLLILRELAKERDGAMPDDAIHYVVELNGHQCRSRGWVRTQLRTLADLGAVKVTEHGETLVAKLTVAGLDHVERRGVIDGVMRPSIVE